MAFRFLSLGDSYTAGEGLKPQAGWPHQLARLLVNSDIPAEKPRVVARTGWTTADLIEGIRQASITGFFDMVTLLIGVNNQYQGLPVEDYEDEFRILLHHALKYAQGHPERVVVLSIPDWGATPYASGKDKAMIATEIDVYNKINHTLASKAGHEYIDITSLSRTGDGNAESLAGDGLHPSEVQYARWTQLLYPIARRLYER